MTLVLAVIVPILSSLSAAQSAPTSVGSVVPAQIAALLGAAPGAGYVLSGTGAAYGRRGNRTFRVTLWVWGSGHSRLTIDFNGGGRYEAVVDGKQALSRGSVADLELPPAGGVSNGCDLLPEGLLVADAATGGIGADDQGASPEDAAAHRFRLYRVPASGGAAAAGHMANATAILFDLGAGSLPERVEYAAPRNVTVRVEYQKYQSTAGVQYPGHVEKFVNGDKRLSVDFAGLAIKSDFSEKDFAVPAMPPPKAPPGPAKRGGEPGQGVRQ